MRFFISRFWIRLQMWGAIWLITTSVLGLLLLISGKQEPIRANPPPTAICLLDHNTLTADGTQLWPGGFAAPCKWFYKEQAV